MSRSVLELPEAANRTIKSLRVYDDPPYGREVLVEFTDGTRISIDLEIQTRMRAKHYRSDSGGGLKVLSEREELSVVEAGRIAGSPVF